jgi:hypothetical protein
MAQQNNARFIPFDRLDMSPRQVVAHFCGYEMYKLVRSDRKNGLEWSGSELTAGTRYLKTLTHGVTLDYTALKAYQIAALQTIFMYVCFFEEKRALSYLCLPGMEKDWYAELFQEIVDHSRRMIRQNRQSLAKGEVFNLDSVMMNAVYHWLNNEHRKEIELRLAEMTETTESPAEEVVTETDNANVINLFGPQVAV